MRRVENAFRAYAAVIFDSTKFHYGATIWRWASHLMFAAAIFSNAMTRDDMRDYYSDILRRLILHIGHSR